MRALLVAALVLAATLAGCASQPDVRGGLVPYPRLGDAATYEARGAHVEIARWENGHPLVADPSRVRFEVAAGPKALDGARQVHETYVVTTSIAEGGPFVDRATLFVAPSRHALVQAVYPLSQDQSVVSFDQRSFPWLFGASALFGEELRPGARYPLGLEDNLGAGARTPELGALAWRVEGDEDGAMKVVLEGSPSIEGTLWMERGSAWPLRARLAILDDGLAPQVRVDGSYPAVMDATRVEVAPGSGDALAPRRSGFEFGADESVRREGWDGEKPPDGDATTLPYLLADATRDAKLLDRGLMTWLADADDPRLSRATHKIVPLGTNETGPIGSQTAPYWLLQWMDKSERYYEVQIERVDVPILNRGVPRVVSSSPVDGPRDESHGWFPKDALPGSLVPLAEGIRVVRQTFGAQGVQVFLRSFAAPPGYSYFLDGGWEGGESGRYTVVYNPATGFVESATGPVSARLSE